MISQTETAGANQYGFYAVPKPMEPKKKYRDEDDDQYQDEQKEDDLNPFATIQDREALNQKTLERDYYVDQAPYPEFKPRERGLDFGVQIQRGDLFDFDLEVRPLIEILVGRSVVSALNQLQEEKERQQHRTHLDKYQKKRNAQLMVTQRLETKNKRKLQQAQRRRLQKQVFVRNRKQAGKKLIAHRNAKECLLGLKQQLFRELQDAGYLRAEPVNDLKINYEEWLYQNIMQALNFNLASQKAAQRLIHQQERSIAREHSQRIEEQTARRQLILDERERLRKQIQQRKEKKRIGKMRKRLNAQRQPDFIRFDQLMQKYEQVTSILKFADVSNGFTANYASRSSIYVSGGLENFIVALLEASGQDLSVEQIQVVLMKVITQSGRGLEFNLAPQHFSKVQQAKQRLHENKGEFMRDKINQVRELSEEISLDLSLFQITNLSIKSVLHNRLIQAVLNIYLTAPLESEQQAIDYADHQKKRLDFADKIIIQRQDASFVKRVEDINSILRVHFQILSSQSQSEASRPQSQLQNQTKLQKNEQPIQEEQWVDIYDGQSWIKRRQQSKKQLNRAQQHAASVTLNGFQNSFVYDERTLYYLQAQLQKLLELNGGNRLKQYSQNLSNIRAHLKKDLPVFDSQLHWT